MLLFLQRNLIFQFEYLKTITKFGMKCTRTLNEVQNASKQVTGEENALMPNAK